jgi:hypothetical protein
MTSRVVGEEEWRSREWRWTKGGGVKCLGIKSGGIGDEKWRRGDEGWIRRG